MRGIGIQLDSDFDLKINSARGADGKLLGFELASTVNQNTALILSHQPGQLKDSPTGSVGLENSLLDTDLLEQRRKIRVALELDQQYVKSIMFSPTELKIDADYKSR